MTILVIWYLSTCWHCIVSILEQLHFQVKVSQLSLYDYKCIISKSVITLTAIRLRGAQSGLQLKAEHRKGADCFHTETAQFLYDRTQTLYCFVRVRHPKSLYQKWHNVHIKIKYIRHSHLRCLKIIQKIVDK